MLRRAWEAAARAARTHPAATVLGLIALLLYLPGSWWGVPLAVTPDRVQAWGSDELAPLGPVAELYSVFLAPEPRIFNPQYPLLHYLVQAVFVAPYLGWLFVTGGLSAPYAEYPFGLADPATALMIFTVLARVPSLLAAAATVGLAAFTAREITGSRMAPWIAGAAVMLLYPMAYYGRTSNVDMGALCWTALTVAVTARILTRGWSLRRAVAVGMAAALATATKDPSYAACLPLGLLLVARQARRPPAGGGWSGIAVALAVAVATYAVASGLVFAHERFRMHLDFILHGSQAVGLDGKPIQSPFYHSNPATIAGYATVLGSVARALRDSMGYPLLVMAGIGLVWPRRARWLALPAVGILVGVILPVRFVQLRFVLIIAYALTLLGAVAIVGLLEDRRRPVRLAAAVLLLGGLAWNGIRVADLTHQMVTDSRYALARWLETTARPGDHVGYYGAPRKLPRLSEGIVTVPMPGQPGYGRFRPTGVDRPEFILVIPQQTFEGAHEWQLSEAAFEQLVSGSTGYRQVYVAQARTMFRHRPITFVNPPVRAFAREDVAEARGLPPRRTSEGRSGTGAR